MRIFAIVLCGLLSGCLLDRHDATFSSRTAKGTRGGVGQRAPERMPLAESQDFLREMLAEAKAQRSRPLYVGTRESTNAVLEDFEGRCKALLARKEPLRKDLAEALEATLAGLNGRWRRVVGGGSDCSSSSFDTSTTNSDTCQKDDDRQKCKDHDHRNGHDDRCDDKKR